MSAASAMTATWCCSSQSGPTGKRGRREVAESMESFHPFEPERIKSFPSSRVDAQTA